VSHTGDSRSSAGTAITAGTAATAVAAGAGAVAVAVAGAAAAVGVTAVLLDAVTAAVVALLSLLCSFGTSTVSVVTGATDTDGAAVSASSIAVLKLSAKSTESAVLGADSIAAVALSALFALSGITTDGLAQLLCNCSVPTVVSQLASSPLCTSLSTVEVVLAAAPVAAVVGVVVMLLLLLVAIISSPSQEYISTKHARFTPGAL
jgi:hypothetical protein